MAQRAPSLVSDTHYCVVGDVTIEATAAIASGVVLQAASGSRIVVGKGVCLAAGVCIQSRAGILSIAEGASLGANVLIVGQGSIGANACISAGSTVINPAVEAEAILPPDTLIESSQAAVSHPSAYPAHDFTNGKVNQPFEYSPSANGVQSGYSAFKDSASQDGSFQNGASQNGSFQSSPFQNGTFQNDAAQNGNGASSLEVRPAYNKVYGREQVSQLISALFPHRQPLDGNSSP